MSELEQVVHPLSLNGKDNKKNCCQNHLIVTTIQKWKGHTSDNFVLDNYFFALNEILSSKDWVYKKFVFWIQRDYIIVISLKHNSW